MADDNNNNRNAAYRSKQESQEYRKKLIEEQFERAKLKNALDGVETEDPVEDHGKRENGGQDYYEPKPGSIPFDLFREDEKKQKSEVAGRLLKVMPIVLCLVLFMWWFNTQADQKQESYDKANTMSSVSVDVLFRKFTNSLEDAKTQYLDERLKVSGKVTFQMSVNDSGCITLDGGDYGMAYAYFDDTSKLSHLSSGDTIVFTGELESYATVDLGTGKILYLYFYDCEFVR